MSTNHPVNPPDAHAQDPVLNRFLGAGMVLALVICALLIVPSYHLTDAKIFKIINNNPEYDTDASIARLLVPTLGRDSPREYILTTRPFLLNLAQPYVLDPQPDIAGMYTDMTCSTALLSREKFVSLCEKKTDPPPAIKLGASLSRFRYWITIGQAGIWRYE
jgi:hypothetical protein